MKDKHLYRLLEIVNRKGDVRSLIAEGITFKEIGDLTALALKQEYFQFSNEAINITEKGLQKLKIDSENFKRTNKEEWILPDLKSKIKKIDKNDIFLPHQNDLSF